MFTYVEKFESELASFYGSPYAVATDSCTHGIELCLRKNSYKSVTVPKRTYLSIPMTMEKLGIEWCWQELEWENYYYIGNTNIIDAAVLWEEDSYIEGTFMCLSFQFKKHLGLGRGGMILTDCKDSYKELKKMVYDGRDQSLPWAKQDIETIGYHYYMTPEVAIDGYEKFLKIKDLTPKRWTYEDYPDLSDLSVFKKS
jgi:dTDP-4-amino-4,6-dideoxygalactose transaminase